MRKIAGWSLLVLGTSSLAWWAHGHHARSIEAQVTKAANAVALDTTHDVDLTVSGRDIMVTGLADSKAEADRIVAQLDGVEGRRVIRTDLQILPTASPYTFGASKPEGGAIQDAKGVVPTAAVGAAVTAALPDADVELAHGAPAGWDQAVAQGVSALDQTINGQLGIADNTITLTGTVQSQAELDAIKASFGSLPDGYTVNTDLALVDDGNPADFNLSYDATTGAKFTGRITDGLAGADLGARLGAANITDDSQADIAPDAIRDADTTQTLALIEAIAPQMPQIESLDLMVKGARPDSLGIDAQLNIATTPDADPRAIANAITEAVPGDLKPGLAITALPAGRIDSDVTERMHQTTGAQQYLVDGQWVEGQSPYTLSATNTAGSVTLDQAFVPDAATRADLAAAANADPSTLTPAYGAPEGWNAAAQSGLAALAQLNDGALSISDKTVTLTGTAATPAEQATMNDALATLPQGFTAATDITVLDDGVPAGFGVTYSASDGASVEGRLHNGLTVDALAQALNVPQMGGTPEQDTSAGAEADVDYALNTLKSLAPLVPSAEALTASFSEGASVDGTQIDVRLTPGSDASAADALAAALPSGAALNVTVDEALEFADGTTRVNAATGKSETVRNGFWLPVWDFAPSTESCAEQSALVLRDYQIRFVSGSAEIEGGSARALSALSSVMDACVAADLTAELGGHTDSTGSAELNQQLSQARADAVVAALVDLGVPADAMVAKGYGPDKPIASNDTEEGRALNRRTEIIWTEKLPAPQTDTSGN